MDTISVTLGIFVVSHIIITVWWASRVNTLLDVVQRDLSAIAVEFKGMHNVYVHREEFVAHKAASELEHTAMLKMIDGKSE